MSKFKVLTDELFIPFFVFRFGWQKLRKTKILLNSSFLLLLFFIFVLPVLPCPQKTLCSKSGNLFLFLVTSSTKTKNKKWDEKLIEGRNFVHVIHKYRPYICGCLIVWPNGLKFIVRAMYICFFLYICTH